MRRKPVRSEPARVQRYLRSMPYGRHQRRRRQPRDARADRGANHGCTFGRAHKFAFGLPHKFAFGVSHTVAFKFTFGRADIHVIRMLGVAFEQIDIDLGADVQRVEMRGWWQ